MKTLKRFLTCAGLMLAAVATPQAKEWRGVVPLHSTRADVERLLGEPDGKSGRYEFDDEVATVIYSRHSCAAGARWNVAPETVTHIMVFPKGLRVADLRLEPGRYRVSESPQRTVYENDEEGVEYHAFEGGGDGRVLEIYYEPGAADRHLLCPEVARQLAEAERSGADRDDPNLPQGDPCPTIEIVGPPDGSCPDQRCPFSANLSGLDPRFTPTFEWSVSAGTIIGQGRGAMEVSVGGLAGKPLTVKVKVGGVIPKYCPDVETYRIDLPRR